LVLTGTSGIAAADPVVLTLTSHKFIPSEFTVPANQKFQIKLTNHDDTPAELESHDLKVEKIVVPGGTITVTAGPLKPGTYEFFDDYHPDDAKGTVTVKE
jgi:heme/copper-type cytochrome/quinol oxidase subunit 2